MTARRLVGLGLVALLLTGCTIGAADPPTAAATPPASATPPAAVSPAPGPPPPDAPELDGEEALAAARARRAERTACDAGFADDAHEVVAEVDGGMLVHVVCFVGAYQTNGELLVWDGAALREVEVEQWQFGEVLLQPEVVGTVEASADGRDVTNRMLYRGLGDCGLLQRWTFDGTTLVLEEAREQECSDDGEVLPQREWPVVYPD